MEHFDVPDEMKVPLDYSDKLLSPAVRTFKPILFQDGEWFGCVLGPNPQHGIFGFGDTPAEAFNDWEKNLKERIRHPRKNDEVVKYIFEVLRGTE